MKLTQKEFKEFMQLMDDYNEPMFYFDLNDYKKQVEQVFNSQGYYAGNSIRIFFNNKRFTVENRF